MGQQSSSSTPKDGISENRAPPTWGSNLLIVNERSDNSPSFEKMAIDGLGLKENLDVVEKFIEDFHKDVMNTKSALTATQNEIVESILKEGKTENESKVEAEEEEIIEDEARAMEVTDDSHIVNYLKQLEEYKAKQRSRRAALDGKNALPAQGGIPITTPKSSPVPKRREKTDGEDDEKSVDIEKSSSEVPACGLMVNDSQSLTEDKTNDRQTIVEDSDEEYREWEKRLKHVQEILEQNLKRLNLQKVGNSEPPDLQK